MKLINWLTPFPIIFFILSIATVIYVDSCFKTLKKEVPIIPLDSLNLEPEISPIVYLDSLNPKVRKAVENTYRLIMVDTVRNEIFGLGSATVFEQKALIAYHSFVYQSVLYGPIYIFGLQPVLLSPHNSLDSIKARILIRRSFADMVLLKLPDSRSEKEICFSNMYHAGDTVYAVGFPGAKDFQLTVVQNVLINSWDDTPLPYYIEASGTIGGGMSGGPMLNSNGCIIGILVGRNLTPPLNTYATSVFWFEEWITNSN